MKDKESIPRAVAGDAPPSVSGAAREGSDWVCPNCQRKALGEFCASCGQGRTEGLISIGAWLRETLADVVALDGTVIRTLRVLLGRPGMLTVFWIEPSNHLCQAAPPIPGELSPAIRPRHPARVPRWLSSGRGCNIGLCGGLAAE
jgi:hypothetical protein